MAESVAYLVSHYPAISHTFVFREVQALRQQGFTVKTASIATPDNVDIMTPEEQAEAKATLCIKDSSLVNIALAHATLKLTAFPRYLKMFGKALQLWWSGPLTLFKAMGMGLSDLAMGIELLARAERAGAGRPLPTRERAAPRLQAAE